MQRPLPVPAIKKSLTIFVILSFLCLGYACSTGMSKEECHLANWQQIGFEDGSVGRSMNYISRHRKSCAKAGIAPDFELYKKGHANGVRQWCNYDTGLNFGEKGRNYEGICPEDLEPAFLKGYDYGKSLFQAREKIKQIQINIDRIVNEIADIEDERVELSEFVVHQETTLQERMEAVSRLNDIPDEIDELESDMSGLERGLQRATRELEALMRD